MHVVGSTTELHVPSPIAANLEEIGRHVADCVDGEIDDPRTAALRMFTNDYVNQYRDQFEEKGEGRFVYVGGDDE